MGDGFIAESSDIFREAIAAGKIYAAWARKLTNAGPADPDVQLCHREVRKAGETVENLLVGLNVPLFKIPASERELDRMVFRVGDGPVVPTPSKNQEAAKPAAVPPPPPTLPARVEKGNEASIRTASLPPSSLLGNLALPVRPLHLLLPLLPRLLLKTRRRY
ncbi:hypothetical protein TNCV_1517061 [Trichonephila clavipes]|nr:hypothetical protein TNCV_1517061 [Trichonephila clavipes]